MKSSDLHPPPTGPNADPVLYGVAAGLADLFPPIGQARPPRAEGDEAGRAEADEDAAD